MSGSVRPALGGWGRLSTATRVVIVSAVAMIGIALASRLIERATESADEIGRRGSSLSTAKTGTAAWRELLERYDVEVTDQRGDLADAILDPRDTLIVIDASVVGEDAAILRDFVADGGRLVTGPGVPPWLRAELEPVPEMKAPVPAGTKAVIGSERRQLDHEHDGYFEEPDGTRTLSIVRPIGSGRVVILADTTPLHNGRLANLDNAAHALDVTTLNRRVVFAEGVHGFGRARGITAIPSRWRAAIIGGLLGGLLTVLAAGRRIGPPEQVARPLAPARRGYAEALGALLGRARQPVTAMGPMQQHVRRWIVSAAGLRPDAADGELQEAAASLGFEADEVGAVVDPIDSDAKVIALGRALSRTQGGVPARPAHRTTPATPQEVINA